MSVKFLASLVALVFIPLAVAGDEGMWPLSELEKLDLAKVGFALKSREIFNPDGSVSMIDAIVNLSGCTASFISANGLILTNHHCAFRAVQEASTPENDYLSDGFISRSLQDEVPAKGMTVKITQSYRDVSRQVSRAVKRGMSPLARTKAIAMKIKEMEIAAEKANPGMRAEIAEMFQGRVYVLFLSTYIRDVRLVYVPPRQIGEFGGESDNWMWPRHTGDFSILRAYVAPDGSNATYSPANVPFRPRGYLKIAAGGVAESDLIFMLGYPGRTYRHQPSEFLRYEEELRMPGVVKLYQWLIETMEQAGKEDRFVQLKLAARIKGLANTMKNYQGKLKGLRNLRLAEKRAVAENEFAAEISDLNSRKDYLALKSEMERVYGEMRASFPGFFFVQSLRANWSLLGNAMSLVEYAHERKKRDQERESAYMTRNLEQTRERLRQSVKNIHESLDCRVARHIIETYGGSFSNVNEFPSWKTLCSGSGESLSKKIGSLYNASHLDPDSFMEMFDKADLEELKSSRDPLVAMALELYPMMVTIRESNDAWKGRLDAAMSRWLEIKQAVQKEGFLPDANSTLRLTWGHVRGYFPRDAVYMKPFTILNGILEKSIQGGDYQLDRGFESLAGKAFESRFYQQGIAGVPVNFLYDADTTGGNSGSAVLNSRGELVGLNFDRTFEATINDYAWDRGYSRSIGVDVRFILWYIEATGASGLLSELVGESGR